MMKKRVKMILVLFIIIGASGCATTPTPKGVLYTKTRGPFLATSNGNITKVGKSDVVSFLSLVSFGDVSVKKICDDAEIDEIHHIDYEEEIILFGLYQRYTVFVYGQ